MAIPTEPDAAKAATTINDRYELRAMLGRGASGTVYRAYDRLLEYEVALKGIHSDLLAELGDDPKLINELRAGQSLNHPSIARTFEFLTDRQTGTAVIVMELVTGARLDQCLESVPDEDQIAFVRLILQQLASALEHIHANGLLHCDIKPSNILVEPRGSIKLIDFSIAAPLRSREGEGIPGDRGSDHTRTAPKGTSAYMAPELRSGARPTPQTDLYAFGMVGTELLSAAAARAAAAGSPAVLGRRRSRASDDEEARLRQILEWCIQKKPDARPASAAELLRALGGELRAPRRVRVPHLPRAAWLAAIGVALISTLAAVHGPSTAPALEVVLRASRLAGVDPAKLPLSFLAEIRSPARLATDAIARHRNDVVRYLLTNWAHTFQEQPALTGQGPVSFSDLACSAVRFENYRALELILEHAPVNTPCSHDIFPVFESTLHATPLLLAHLQGDDEATRILLQHGATLEQNVAALPFETFFLLAVYGSAETFEQIYSTLLLAPDFRFDELPYATYIAASFDVTRLNSAIRAGLDPNAPSGQGLTPLHHVIGNRHLGAVRTLLAVPSVDRYRPSALGTLPLFHLGDLFQGGKPLGHLVDYLAKSGIDPNVKSPDGRTFPGYLAARATPEALAQILRFPGLDVNAVDSSLRSPLHIAVLRASAAGDTIRLFAARGAALDAMDDEGRTPLDFAYQHRKRDAIEALEALGARRGAAPARESAERAAAKRVRKLGYDE